MKYPPQQFEKLIAALLSIRERMPTLDLSKFNVHTLHFFVYKNKNFDDENPNVTFIDGKRLFELDRDFELYPGDTNDDNIETAMKRALKQVETTHPVAKAA